MNWKFWKLLQRQKLDFMGQSTLAIAEVDQLLDDLRILFKTPVEEQDKLYDVLERKYTGLLLPALALVIETSALLLVWATDDEDEYLDRVEDVPEGTELILKSIRKAFLAGIDRLAEEEIDVPDYPPDDGG
jgi:hypothetical protein